MHTYLPHLLADIAAAHRSEGEGEPHYAATFEEELEDMERWLHTEPEVTFGQYCGLEGEQFPPAEKWTEEELQEIITAFWHLLFSWNMDANLPEDLPPAMTYDFLVRTLEEKIHVTDSGFTTIEFCWNEPLECPFGPEYCTCQKYLDAADGNRAVSPLHDRVMELVWAIRSAIERMPESLEFQDAMGELQSELDGGERVYQPLAAWLGIDLSEFPEAEGLSDWELAALADVLLSLFDGDDDLATPVKLLNDPARRYGTALELFSMPVHHDGFGHYSFKPLTEEERNARPPVGLSDLLDFLDFGDGDGHELKRDGEAADELPF